MFENISAIDAGKDPSYMRISLSESRASGFKKWSDAHPAKLDPLSGDGQDPDYPMNMPVERPHLPWLIPGVGRL
jgi:hypothetical protein